MEIIQNKQGTKLELQIKGRMDTTTAPQLEAVIKNELGDVKNLVIDMSELEYVSSAGLRVLLAAQKIMNKQGEMVLSHVSENIKEVFDITGFSDILTIV